MWCESCCCKHMTTMPCEVTLVLFHCIRNQSCRTSQRGGSWLVDLRSTLRQKCNTWKHCKRGCPFPLKCSLASFDTQMQTSLFQSVGNCWQVDVTFVYPYTTVFALLLCRCIVTRLCVHVPACRCIEAVSEIRPIAPPPPIEWQPLLLMQLCVQEYPHCVTQHQQCTLFSTMWTALFSISIWLCKCSSFAIILLCFLWPRQVQLAFWLIYMWDLIFLVAVC